MKKSIELIRHNKVRHDSVVSEYDKMHVEIFNTTEQARIGHVVKWAVSEIRTGALAPVTLDFGAGTGNLTMHLWHLGAEVSAADVSEESLKRLKEKIGDSTMLSTVVLNGEDLSNFSDNTFDLVATYSVLHHIPDYLAIIEEFVRIVRPGGIIYIDHEVCPDYWKENAVYQAYLEELGPRFSKEHLNELKTLSTMQRVRSTKLRSLFSLSTLKSLLTGEHGAGRYENVWSSDGDIHVFKDDHIEWDAIMARLGRYCEILAVNDYLVCRERGEVPSVWVKWKDHCADMRFVIARKIEKA